MAVTRIGAERRLTGSLGVAALESLSQHTDEGAYWRRIWRDGGPLPGGFRYGPVEVIDRNDDLCFDSNRKSGFGSPYLPGTDVAAGLDL